MRDHGWWGSERPGGNAQIRRDLRRAELRVYLTYSQAALIVTLWSLVSVLVKGRARVKFHGPLIAVLTVHMFVILSYQVSRYQAKPWKKSRFILGTQPHLLLLWRCVKDVSRLLLFQTVAQD